MKRSIGMSVLGLIVGVVVAVLSAGGTYLALNTAFPREDETPKKTSTAETKKTEDAPLPSQTAEKEYAAALKDCSAKSITYAHPLTGEEVTRTIIGMVADKCQTTEEMPNNGMMTCNFDATQQQKAAQYYEAVAAGSDISSADENGTTVTKVNGEVVEYGIDMSACATTGYDDPIEGGGSTTITPGEDMTMTEGSGEDTESSSE